MQYSCVALAWILHEVHLKKYARSFGAAYRAPRAFRPRGSSRVIAHYATGVRCEIVVVARKRGGTASLSQGSRQRRGPSEMSLTTFSERSRRKLPLVCSPPFILPTHAFSSSLLAEILWCGSPAGSMARLPSLQPILEIVVPYVFNYNSHSARLSSGRKRHRFDEIGTRLSRWLRIGSNSVQIVTLCRFDKNFFYTKSYRSALKWFLNALHNVHIISR